MPKSTELLLHSVFLKNRIAELGIKQWWLAEQIGVDRKTVIRWVQGQVKHIQTANAEALAKILQCEVRDLSLQSEAEQLASVEDQKNAASLITASSLIDKLGPIGEWNVIEGLLKATVVPHLPLRVLGELYNQLTVASWRQSKIDQAAAYNAKAEEIARKCQDKSVLAGALLSKANILSWRGKTKSAIDTYQECLQLERFLEPRAIGSTYSNLGAVLYEAGDLERGEELQKKALEVFQFHGKPMNLSIAWCHLAIIYLQKEEVPEASHATEKSISLARQDEYKRGQQMGELLRAEVLARQKREKEARAALDKGLEGFAQLGIEEGLNYEFAGRVLRILGDHAESARKLRHGISLSGEFPLSLAALHAELAKTTVHQDPIEAKQHTEKAKALYLACEAPLRAAALDAT
jgi:tetratricopeptide (TPR) repeat protein